MAQKKGWRDRWDGRYIDDIPGMNKLMMSLYPKRTEAEVNIKALWDVTEIVRYLERKNAEHPNYKTTIFHYMVTAGMRMVRERPALNRFIQGHKMYLRHDITCSFDAKRRFADGAEESLILLRAGDDDTLDSLSHQIYGDVTQVRRQGRNAAGSDDTIDRFAKLPPMILAALVWLVRRMDFWGIAPRSLAQGDPNFTTILFSNMGSIRCGSVAHHLNNYGTNSIMLTLGRLHKEELPMADGHREIRDVVDYCVTVDERIADGYYFAKSLRLLEYLSEHPEALEKPFSEHSGCTYE